MKFSLIVVILMIALNSFAQKDSARIVVYDAFNANQTVDPENDIVHPKNLVKWNMGMLVRGAFEMDYERALSDKFTVEVGAGVTYFDPLYLIAIDVSGDGYFSDNSKNKYGPLFTGSLRFYPQDVTGFEGMYIAVPFRYRAYFSEVDITYSAYNNGSFSTENTRTFKNNHSHFEYGFLLGYQSGNYYDVVWDYYIGVGINSSTLTYPVYDDNSVPFQYKIDKSKPTLFCGFKLGLPF